MENAATTNPGGNYIYYILLALIVFMTIKNFIQLRRLSHERKFAEAYSKVLKEEENASEAIENYIANEKREDYKKEAAIVLGFAKMLEGKEAKDTIESISIKEILEDKKGFSSSQLNLHSDLFIWINLLMAKMKELSLNDQMDSLYSKVTAYENDLNNRLEYLEFKAIYYVLTNKEGAEKEFLNKILEGDYAGISHDKRLVGLYKRMASCFVAYSGKELDEFFENDLHSFSATSVGKHLMTALGIYEKYKPQEEEPVKEETKEVETKEETEEVKEEPVEETKEENK